MVYPIQFYITGVFILVLISEAMIKRARQWAVPSLAVYGTTLAWYFIDPFVNPEEYSFFPARVLGAASLQIATFIVVFRLIVPFVTKEIAKGTEAHRARVKPLRLEALFIALVILWIPLLLFGIYRMRGDVFATLFPIDSRAGVMMWQRGAADDAGSTGFIVSSCSYLYGLVCGLFGVTFVFQRTFGFRILNLILIATTWPYFLLSGTRSIFLAVCLPLCFSYLFFVRHPPWLKTVVLIGAFCLVSVALRIVIANRNVGFRELFEASSPVEMLETEASHQGLNMLQELCYINIWEVSGEMNIAYGGRYLEELLNVVPRRLWPDKPVLGVDYAKWRGFGGGDSDIGVYATVSMGLVGAGIVNFGRWIGPAAPALLLSLWCGLLARWREQRTILRTALFLAGMGLTFNLGRDITLLVLWPVVFGFVIVWVTERVWLRVHRSRVTNTQSDAALGTL